MFPMGLAACLLLAALLPAHAGEPSLLCFGNEPSWSLSLERPGEALFAQPDAAPVTHRGQATELWPHGERLWRGRADGGGDLVAFLREAPCSDGMSDVEHPVVVRVSLPDGRALAGCCRIPASGSGAAAPSTAAPPGSTSPSGAQALEGRVWRLEALPGQDAVSLAAVPGGVTIELANGTLQAFAGCNRMRGGYRIDGDQLELDALAGTMMACPPPIMAVEDAVRSALAGRLRFAVAGDRLTLTSGADRSLVFAPVPPPALEGTHWIVTGFNNGREAVVSPLGHTTVTLSFLDGQISGNAGCNQFRASYVAEGHDLVVGRVSATRKTCPGEGVMEQEREVLAAIESATRWAIERDLLDMHRADGQRALTAKPSR